jgi:hypothetical protein
LLKTAQIIVKLLKTIQKYFLTIEYFCNLN